MSLTDLLTALEAEAAREAAQAQADAQVQTDAIVAAARAEADRLRREIPAAAAAEAASRGEHRRAAARQQARAWQRSARHEAVEALRTAVVARMDGLRARPDYPALLGALLDEALGALPVAVVLTDPRDVGLCARLLAERGLDLPVEGNLHTSGGIGVDASDGRTVLNTVETRLAIADLELARAVDAAATEHANEADGTP